MARRFNHDEAVAQWIAQNGPPIRHRVEMPEHLRGERHGACRERRIEFRRDWRPKAKAHRQIRVRDRRYLGILADDPPASSSVCQSPTLSG